MIIVPARIHDIRTPAEKEEDSKKAVYNLLSNEFQNWGTLERKAREFNISKATLSKHLKNFVALGMVIKEEGERVDNRRPRQLYRLTSTTPIFDKITERGIHIYLNKHSSTFNEGHARVLDQMELAVNVFSYELAIALNQSCGGTSEHKAEKYLMNLLDVKLKDKLRDIMKVFYKFRKVEHDAIPIQDYLSDYFLIRLEDSIQNLLPKDLLEKSNRYLDNSEVAWILLTRRNPQKELNSIIDDFENYDGSAPKAEELTDDSNQE